MRERPNQAVWKTDGARRSDTEAADLLSAAERLTAAGCIAATDEAEELLARAQDAGTLEEWMSRREAGEPLAWITGRHSFAGLSLSVVPGVYVPRAQSQELATRAVSVLPAGRPRVADFCTGAGAMAAWVSAAAPHAVVVGTEIDPAAVHCAYQNAVAVIRSTLGAALRSRAFDVVTAVAPYVPTGELANLPRDVQRYEPELALDGGPDGLDVVRGVIAEAARVLRPGGWLLLELGGEQDIALRSTLEQWNFELDSTWDDVDGDLRGLMARLGTTAA